MKELFHDINSSLEIEERILIGTLILDISLVPKVQSLLGKVSLTKYKTAYDILVSCFTEGQNILKEFNERNIEVSKFIEAASFSTLIEAIVTKIKNLNSAVKLYTILYESLLAIPTKNLTEFSATIQQRIVSEADLSNSEASDIRSVISEYRTQQQFYIDKFKNGGEIIGLSTGIPKLDQVIDGLRPEHLWVIGGYTSVGKTFAALNIVADLVRHGKRAVFYSLEMSKADILSRLVGILTNQSGLTVLKGFPHDEQKVADALKLLEDSKLAIYTEKNDLAEIQFSMYDESLKDKPVLFVVDYLGLVSMRDSKSEYETTTKSIIGFQQIAKRLKTTVMVLSQVSNEGARRADEVVMSFKSSGAIAAAADFALELVIGEEDKERWLQKMNNNEPVVIKWLIRKNRHGPKGFIEMTFDGKTGVFAPYNRASGW